MHQTPPPPVPAIIQPWRPFRSAAAQIAAVASAAASIAYAPERVSYGPSGGVHLGERQRVNLYRSKGGGKRRRK